MGRNPLPQRVIGQSAFVKFRLGGSAFNIKAESLWLGDFTEIEARIRALLAGDTAETRQEFDESKLARTWKLA